MPARTMLDRPHQPGRNLSVPFATRVAQAARDLVAPVFDNERSVWQRCAPLLLLAAISTLPLIVVAAGVGVLFTGWLVAIYLLSGYLWVEQASIRADGSHYWRAFLLIGLGLGVASLWLPVLFATSLPAVIGLAAVATIVAGVRLHLPSNPRTWYLLAGALVLIEVAHLAAVIQTMRDASPPLPTGFVSIAGLLLLSCALWLLLHRRLPGSSRIVLLDTAIVASGLALLTWVIAIAPQIATPRANALEQTLQLGWPLTALVAIVVVVRFLLTRWPTDNLARHLMGAGLGLFIVAIVAWSAIDVEHSVLTEHPGGNLLWLLAMVAFGTASLHPSMVSLAQPIHEHASPMTWQRGLLLTLSILMVPVALVMQVERGDQPTISAIAGFATLLGLLGAARLANVQHERTSLAVQQNTLRLVAADLLTSQHSAAAVAAAEDAAHAIAGSGVSAALYLSDGTPGEYVCPNVSVDGQCVSRVIRERDLPISVRRLLIIGTAAWLNADELTTLRSPLGLDDDTVVASIAPIGGEHGLRGMLVTAGNRLTPDVSRAQETLASLLALALDRRNLHASSGDDVGRPALLATAANGATFTFVDVGSSDDIAAPGDVDDAVGDELQLAIENDQLVVRYQPRLDLVRGRIVAVEMLAAWESPLVGPIPRGALSAIAEDEGLSRALRRSLLRLAGSQIADWQARYPDRELDLVVPLSLAEIEVPGLIDDVGLTLAKCGADPTRLVLQLTASTLLEASQHDLDALASLTAIGVQLAIGDAGASWSALTHFSGLAFNAIELEAPLTSRLADDERATAIATRLIAYAHEHGACVVARGIDRREDWVRLRKLSCDFGQGTLFSPPITATDLDTLLNRAQQRVSAS